MSYVNEITIKDANDHDYIHPMQFVGKLNSCLAPWKIVDMDFKPSASGRIIMHCRFIDMHKYGATRINEITKEKEHANGIEVSLPLNGLLPTADELEVLLEAIRQDLGIAGIAKIYTGR